MAAKKKDFSNISTGNVYDTIASATAEVQEEYETQDTQETSEERKERKTYNEQERDMYMSARRTGGRKGMKLPRVNMAFSPELYDYVRTMSKVRGETMTDFINHIVEISYNENKAIYEKAVEFRNSL